MRYNIEVVFLLLALIGEIIGTIGGFGSSVFFVPTANYYFDFHAVLGITAVFHVASNMSKILLFKKGLDRTLIIYLGIPAVLFVITGGLLSRFISVLYLEIALGLFLILLSSTFLLLKQLKVSRGKMPAMIGGSLSGFIAGVLGTGGAIRGLTMAAFNLEKSAFVATSAVIDLGVDASRAIVYLYNGYIKSELLVYIPFLIIIAIVGSWIGKKILNHIPQNMFKRLSLLLILIIGILTLVNALS